MFRTILVSYDGSDHATRALATAIRLAGELGASLHVAHSPQIDTPATLAGPFVGELQIPLTQEDIAEIVANARVRITELVAEQGGTLASCEIVRGDPARNTLRMAEAIGADLIVMGRRGLGAFGALALGSVSQEVSKRATCAVLTVA